MDSEANPARGNGTFWGDNPRCSIHNLGQVLPNDRSDQVRSGFRARRAEAAHPPTRNGPPGAFRT